MVSKDISIGGGASRVNFNSTNSILLPSGDVSERVDEEGAVRYNTALKRVEICDKKTDQQGAVTYHWNSLQGLIDEDSDTKITVQEDFADIDWFVRCALRQIPCL